MMSGRRCGHPANVLLPFHVNGTLSAPEEGEVRAHVRSCATCRAEIATLEKIADAIRSVPEQAPRAARPWRPSGIRWALAIAAVLAVGWPAIVLWRATRPAPDRAGAARVADAGPAPAGNASVAVASLGTEVANGTMSHAVYLDLGGGPTRGGADVPRLPDGSDGDLVVLTLTLPRRPGTTDRFELVDPSGRVVARSDAQVTVDTYGRTTLVLRRSLLADHGTYALALRGADGSGSSDPAPSYPFEVGTGAHR
jgi:hypothetical protein